MKLKLNQKTIDIIVATDFKERLIGLMGKKDIDFGMLFPKCNSIHTFFMKEEIDCLGLNENNEIIFIERNLGKNRIVRIHRNIKKTSILELPKNTSQDFSLGDVLDFTL